MSTGEKKGPMGKVKAAQMSRQLIMRLSYAKLKVDHGWQKQNLNEVENLYFHHYRVIKPTQPQSPLPPPTYISDDPEKEQEPSMTVIEYERPDKDDLPEAEDVQPLGFPLDKTPPRTPSPSLRASGVSNILNSTNLTPRPSRIPVTPQALVHPASRTPPSTPTPAKASAAIPSSIYNPLRTPPSNSNLINPTTPPPSLNKDVQAGNPPSTPNFASPVPGMTYDSFWSSMSGTPQTPYKNSLASGVQFTTGTPKGKPIAASRQTNSNT